MTKEILICSIADRKYGIEVGGLQSIENYTPPTPVASAPEFIAGIVKIREDVYPVLDLRSKFSLPKTEPTEETKYVLLKTNAGMAACMVDSVCEIFNGTEETVQPFPDMIRTKETEYADCVVKANDTLVLVISSAHLLTLEETKEVTSVIEDNIEQ